jgi:CelD/BcsL family acetyltransferase involved in cellulose biosynthesis
MKVDIITDRKGFDALSGEWNALLRASPADTVFLTWEWVSAWLDAVCPDAHLLVIAVRDDDGRLAAVAPFYGSAMRLLGLSTYRCLRILGDVDSGAEYADVPVRPGCEEEAFYLIARALSDCRSRWDCIWLCNVAAWTRAAERFERLFSHIPVFVTKWTRAFSTVMLPVTYDAYLGSLSSNARSAIRRQRKRLMASGPVETVQCERQRELPEFLSSLFDLHHRRWAALGQEGCFTRQPRMVQFYQRFAPVALERGWLRLFALRSNGTTLAMQYGYVYNLAFFQLQEGFDPSGTPGVGNVLRDDVLRACMTEHLREYDFLGGDTEHKRRWGGNARFGVDLLIGRKSLKNAAVFGLGLSPTGRYLRPVGPLPRR